MGKRLSTKEMVVVLILFFSMGSLGLYRYRITRDRYKVYIANCVANKIEKALLKHSASAKFLKDTTITDYGDFVDYFPQELPHVDFKGFLYRIEEGDYYISIVSNDRNTTEVLRKSE